MSDKLTSWLRTVFPWAWSLLVAWLVSLGLPDAVTGWVSGLGTVVADVAVGAVVYAFLRWVEPRMPDWLTRVFLGSAKPPIYAPRNADGSYTLTTTS
ncbi:hypothetical protein [Prauserella flavalba]|uniref:hypothetical protein n=1 Tax=Prauserella flavalba TaxID=1477506 RepID=UPI0036E8FCA3